MENLEQQEIVKEYFEKQKNSNLTICIYEERANASKDIEWFYKDNNWCHIKISKHSYVDGYKETYNGEIKDIIKKEDVYSIETKRFKTFGKKCHVTTMSFQNFIILEYMNYNGYKNYAKIDEVEKYKDEFLRIKKEAEKENGISNFTIKDYHNYLNEKQKQKEALKKKQSEIARKVFLWLLSLLFLQAGIISLDATCFFLGVFTCPLFHKFCIFLLNKKEYRKNIEN